MYSREEQERAAYYYDDGRRKRLPKKENIAYLFNIFSMSIAICCICQAIGALIFRDCYYNYRIINIPMIYGIYRLYKKIKFNTFSALDNKEQSEYMYNKNINSGKTNIIVTVIFVIIFIIICNYYF